MIAATTIHEMIATLRRIEDRLAQVVGKLDIVIDALGSELEEQGEFDLEGNPTPGRKRDEGNPLVEMRLTGLDGVLKLLESLPPELVSKRGGPVKSALRKGALVIFKAAKANLQAAVSNTTEQGKRYSTGLLLANLVVTRGKAPTTGKGERYLVRVRKKSYGRKGEPTTTLKTAQLLEYGRSQQPAEPWLRPAFNATASRAITTVQDELLKNLDRIVKKLSRGGEEVILPPVFQTLKASAEVKAIVGTNPPRIYRHGSVPQYTDRPYISWFLVSGIPENNLSDPPPADRSTVQIDAWHPEDAGVELLAHAIREAVEPAAHCIGVIVDGQEVDTKLYRMALQFDWFYR